MADQRPTRPPRARPVAAEPLESLEAEAEQLARRWAAELVLGRPLGALGRISLEEVGRGAAELCHQVLRALRSDAELARLLAPDAPERGAPFADRPAALSGAREASSVVAAVESLRGVLLQALLGELDRDGAERARRPLVVDAGDRLAHVCAELAAVAVARERPVATARPARFPERPPGPRVMPEPAIRIVDEREAPATGEEVAQGEPPPGRRAAGTVEEPWTRARRDSHERRERRGAGLRGERATAGLEPARTAPPAALHDAREQTGPPAQGPAAWIRSIGEHLQRFERDGLPFAVVLMQLDGAGAAEAEIEAALERELRGSGGGTVTREREGRWWLIAQRADRVGAHTLAARLEQAAAAAAGAAGARVAIATGTALCPEDGRQAPALAAHADVGLYAARWESGAGRAGGS